MAGYIPQGNGTFFRQTPTGVGDAGAGVLDDAFQYPFTLPAQPLQGGGNYTLGQIVSCSPEGYYTLTVPNAPAQGGGNIAGTVTNTPLLENFYNPSANEISL